MLDDGLLQSKKDGLTGVLLSRKRKLEELLFATVIWHAQECPPQSPLYEAKERAFLDANDITQGRFFDEATLPDRPDFTSLIPPRRSPTQQINLGSSSSKRNDSYSRLSPAVAHRASGSKASDDLLEDGQDEHVDQRAKSKLDVRHKSPLVALKPRSGSPESCKAVSGLEDESKGIYDDGGTTASAVMEASVDREPAIHGQFDSVAIDDATSVNAPQKNSSLAEPTVEHAPRGRQGRSPRVATAHDEDQRKTTRTAPNNYAEQASSPNSTVGHHSSNTPGATGVSPDTSPENDFLDEDLEIMGQAQSNAAHKSSDDPSGFAERSTVPRQPDKPSGMADSSLNAPPDSQSMPRRSPGLVLQEKSVHTVASQPLPANYSQPTDAFNQPPSISSIAQDKSIHAAGQKPLMKIDTNMGSMSSVGDATLSRTGGSINDRFMDSPLSMGNSATPRRAQAASFSVPSPPERMTTRVSSGAIRHKSVSEILGGPPKPAANQTEKGAGDKLPTDISRANSTGESSTPESPDASTIRLRPGERREKDKERSKLSTVVFAKQPPAERTDAGDITIRDGTNVSPSEDKDYLHSLFVSQAYAPPRCPPLKTLLGTSHKILTTSNACLELRDQQDSRIMKRIYQLQFSNRWPLRQQERSQEPPRPKSHWDFILDEMKWLRTDFREERKWKIVLAKTFADWCADYCASDDEHKALLRVKVNRPALPATEKEDVDMVDQTDEPKDVEMGDVSSQPTPELVASGAGDSPSESPVEILPEYPDTVAPSTLFSMSAEEIVFDIRRTAATEKLLEELPLYQPYRIGPEGDATDPTLSPDSSWKKDIVPASRFVESKIQLIEHKPPKKRGRYDYEMEEEDDHEPPAKRLALAAEQTDVALFSAEYKPLRDRIHPSHQFRPPSEFPMPTQSFLECRQSSQWTAAEDDELRRLVREYSYNWSLISSVVSPKSLFFSGAERRTPWECFERWIGLEGLPADMSKTHYFRAYSQRIEGAQRNVMAQQAAAHAAQGNNAQPMRRRTTQPVKVERRRANRYLAILDGMRKLAKKRETAMVKQQQQANISAMRKTNDAAQPKPPFSTPQEFSRLKHDRELKLVERQEQYRLQVLAHQRNVYAQRNAQQANANAQQLPNGVQTRNVGTASANGSSPVAASPMPNGLPQPGIPNQVRPHPQLQALPNGQVPNGMGVNMVPMKGVPQGQMPPNGMAQTRVPTQMSPEHMRAYLEANRLQQEQRMLQQQRQPQLAVQGQGHGQPGPHSSPNMGNMAMNGSMNNPGMSAPMHGGNMGSPSLSSATMINGNASSPRMGQARPLSSGVIPTIHQISTSLQARHPNLSPEQISKMTTDHLTKYQHSMSQQSMSQAAMNAAAGNSSAAAANYGLPTNEVNIQPGLSQPGGMSSLHNNPQAATYAHMLRMQQQSQQNQQRGGMGVGVPVMNGAGPGAQNGRQQSRSATPQTQNRQRSGSGPGAGGPGMSPVPPQAQISS